MPWKESKPMDECIKFIARLLDGEDMSVLCQEFGILRPTAYKIFNRYKSLGLQGLEDQSQAQNVKDIVDDLRTKNRFENQYHRVVYRPWGSFDCIEEGHRFKVKRITVKPGASSSLQKHHHRSEHWVIVSGTARVTKGDKVVDLTENESIYIEAGEIHAIANPGVIPLDLIEVQTGSYLGEDDIVRFDDLYGREDK